MTIVITIVARRSERSVSETNRTSALAEIDARASIARENICRRDGYDWLRAASRRMEPVIWVWWEAENCKGPSNGCGWRADLRNTLAEYGLPRVRLPLGHPG
jgi:hypothetical protein